jgi:hypothetical protein
MDRINKKAEKFLTILYKCSFDEVYTDGNRSDFDLAEKYKSYTQDYIELIKREFVKHPEIPMPDRYGNVEDDHLDSVVTPKGKAYLEELNRNILERNMRFIAWLVTTGIAVTALVISIIALNK